MAPGFANGLPQVGQTRAAVGAAPMSAVASTVEADTILVAPHPPQNLASSLTVFPHCPQMAILSS